MSRRNLEKEFNFDIYLYNYDDIKNIYLKNRKAAYDHWIKNGAKEGRTCNLIVKSEHQEEYNNLDWQAYLNNNPDLKRVYSTQTQAWIHWIEHGKHEGRQYYNKNNSRPVQNSQPVQNSPLIQNIQTINSYSDAKN